MLRRAKAGARRNVDDRHVGRVFPHAAVLVLDLALDGARAVVARRAAGGLGGTEGAVARAAVEGVLERRQVAGYVHDILEHQADRAALAHRRGDGEAGGRRDIGDGHSRAVLGHAVVLILDLALDGARAAVVGWSGGGGVGAERAVARAAVERVLEGR